MKGREGAETAAVMGGRGGYDENMGRLGWAMLREQCSSAAEQQEVATAKRGYRERNSDKHFWGLQKQQAERVKRVCGANATQRNVPAVSYARTKSKLRCPWMGCRARVSACVVVRSVCDSV